MVDYSTWNKIDVSDDEDDTHPNIDTPSLFRLRHSARLDKMKEIDEMKAQLGELRGMLSTIKQHILQKEDKSKAGTSRNTEERETLKTMAKEMAKEMAKVQDEAFKTLTNELDSLAQDGETLKTLSKQVQDQTLETLEMEIEALAKEIETKEKNLPWNVDTLSKEKFSRTFINNTSKVKIDQPYKQIFLLELFLEPGN